MTETERIVLEKDGPNSWFAHVEGHREETQTNGPNRTETLESLLWQLEDEGWP